MFKENAEAFRPKMGTRLKRALKKKSTYASMLPGVAIAKNIKKVRHEHRKKKAMQNLADGASSALVHGSASASLSRAKMKRNLAVANTMVSVASAATTLTTGGISGVVGGAVGGVGGSVLGLSTASVTHSTVRAGTTLATFNGTNRSNRSNNTHIMSKRVTNTSGKDLGDLNHYKNQRAMLYSLGQGVQTDNQVNTSGRNSYFEQTRLEIKREYGADPDTDLFSRQKVSGDWLKADERESYQLLKAGTITSAQVPRRHRLPLLWEANKLFDFHERQLREASK
jgi:hypothetical protein